MSDKTIDIDDVFVTIRKGAVIAIPNPLWDGDDPTTHFYHEGEVTEDFVIFMVAGSGTHPVTVTIDETKPHPFTKDHSISRK